MCVVVNGSPPLIGAIHQVLARGFVECGGEVTRSVTVTGAPSPDPEAVTDPPVSVSSFESSLEDEGALAEGSAAWIEEITYALEAPGVPATLNVTLMGTGSGTVTSNAVGLNCSGAIGQTCAAAFQAGDVVTLHQAAMTGTFTGWGGACSGLGACTVTLSPATLVVAHFMVPPPIVTQYYHLDVIGSVRAVTRGDGTLLRRQDYAAFGEEIACPERSRGASDEPEALPGLAKQPKFAGKPRDPETGLDCFGARHSGARWGRFTAVDPKLLVDDAVGDPQRWHRYSYALNRPLRYADPDGANPAAIKFLLEAVQKAATSPTAQRAQQAIATHGSQLYVSLTRLLNSAAGQELVQVSAELLTGTELGPAATFKWELAERIGRGHALAKHVYKLGDLRSAGVNSGDELVALTASILDRYSLSNLKFLSRGRFAIWDEVSGTVWIYDPSNPDLGTLFSPSNGRAYWEGVQ